MAEDCTPATSGVFNYCARMEGVPLFCGDQPENSRIDLEPHEMPVFDMRETSPTLQREGFMLDSLPLAVSPDDADSRIAAVYRPLLQEYLRDLTGAAKVVCRMPMLRFSNSAQRSERINAMVADYVHADFSREDFYKMAEAMVADDSERDRWLAGHFAVYQTWRALSAPPQDKPLALMDRRTILAQDVVPADNIVGRGDSEQKFQNFTFRYNPAQRWSYVSDMTLEDVMLFIGFDNADDTIPGIPHCAFDYGASSGRETIPRISCELRAFVYWG